MEIVAQKELRSQEGLLKPEQEGFYYMIWRIPWLFPHSGQILKVRIS